MVLAHRERTSPKPTQRDLSIRRMTSGRPAPLPGPGTYARHNAVDMPALLPDGTSARLSVSAVMGVRVESGTAIASPGSRLRRGTPPRTRIRPPATAAMPADEEERW